MNRNQFFILFLGLFALLILVSLNRSVSAAVSQPQLKWQQGGCFSSWCQTGWYASPAIADLDKDGKAEVIWGSYDVIALNGEDGTLQWRATSGSRVWPAVAVVDLTGDGSLEIIVGRGGDQVTVYNAAGQTVWTRSPFGSGEVRTLAVTDLDGDGSAEIIAGRAGSGSTRQVNVYSASGQQLTGWPARRDGEAGYGWGMYNENITVADFDNDGDKELIAPTDTHYITALDHGGNQLPANPIYGSGEVWSQVGVHVDHAVDLRGYANCGSEHRPNFANMGPAAGDLDGDGSLEIVVPGDVYNCAIGDNVNGDLYIMPWILNLDRTRWGNGTYDWTVLPAPPPNSGPLSENYSVIENSVTNAVLADLDGDGQKEIIFAAYDGRVHAYWLDKTQHGSWPYRVPGSGIRFAAEPIVVDLDADGRAEVIFTSWPQKGSNQVGQLHMLDYLGNELHRLVLPPAKNGSWNGGLAAPTIGNIDSDSDLELVIGTSHSGVIAYDLPNSASARVLWGTGRGSYERTGEAPALNDYTVQLDSTARAIAVGESTIFQVEITAGAAFTDTVELSAPSPAAGIAVSLSDINVNPPANVTLTVTDQRVSPSALPGDWVDITLSSTALGETRAVDLDVLIGGSRIYLPFVAR